MSRYLHFIGIFLLLCCTHVSQAWAQRIGGGFDMYNFFDNSEGNDDYRNTVTHAGTRFTPKLLLSSNDSTHRISGGYNFLYEFGESGLSKGAVEVYYQYKHKNLRVLFGSFPRTLMHEQMPEYLICDSIRYFRPEMAGFDFLYTDQHGHVEVFLDWIQKQSPTEREQFMAGVATRFHFNKFQLGMEGHLYHYALEGDGHNLGHSIHEVITAHPFVGLLLSNKNKTFYGDLRGGLLLQADRDREDMKWHVPVGFIADADIQLYRFLFHETFYAGKSQQFFGNKGFGKYYWGDTFTRSKWYSRTDLGYDIVRNKYVDLMAKLIFNFTDKGMQWHQMLTLRVNLAKDYSLSSNRSH